MAQLVVRNIEDEVKERLRKRAAAHGHSMVEEVREILRGAVARDATQQQPFGQRLQARFAGIGIVEDIEELRGSEARPADLDG